MALVKKVIKQSWEKHLRILETSLYKDPHNASAVFVRVLVLGSAIETSEQFGSLQRNL